MAGEGEVCHLHKKEKENNEEKVFSSKIGLICSCLGCVVGTGNIWRFPRIVANSSEDEGGLVFLLVWLLFLGLWSIPMLIVEYSTGRYTKKALIQSFRYFLGDKAIWCGAWVSFVSFAISCYYSVILGWCLYYMIRSIGWELPTSHEQSLEIFYAFARDSYWPILTHGIAISLAGLSVFKGIKELEKVNMVLIPILLIIILFMFIWAMTRQLADRGITFLFSPAWSSFGNPRLWVDAISQNAFDTGAGMGLLVPYASYMTRNHGIVRYGTLIPCTNNLIRIPVLFSSVGVFGRVTCVLFFICLSCAGLSSLISNIELMAHTFEDFGISRKIGDPVTVVVTFLVGLMSALNLDILTNQDFTWGFALLVSGLFFQFMIIKFGASRFRQMVVNDYSTDDWHLPILWQWMITVIAPLEAVVILVWWVVDLVSKTYDDGAHWYDFGIESLFTVLVQWFSVLLVLILINVILVRIQPRWLLHTSPHYNDFDSSSESNEETTETTGLRHNDIHATETYQSIAESKQ